MPKFITIGEPLVVMASQDLDVSLDEAVHFKKYLAGAEFNVALGINRLEHSVGYISKVGSDTFGRFIVEAAQEAGLDTRNLIYDENLLTGVYLKQCVSKGDPATSYFRKNSAASNLKIEDIDMSALKDVQVAHLSGIFAALSDTALQTFKTFNDKLNENKVLTVFDPNLRPALWKNQEEMVSTLNDLAKKSQIILPGINEGKILMGSSDPEVIADFYLKQSDLTTSVVVKLGAEGAYVKTKSGQAYTVPGFKVANVVDTVGAGDGFAVGLESALLEGKSLKVAVHRACAIGALAVQSAGDSEGYPTRQELMGFYKSQNYQGDL
ncbi:sugar kinase [Lactococcus petauri]|uniref:2-dehydro-3-deoxygluconokinase n=1 Tax=Lactococcus petauri TaxID=1940789 RepID=A0A252CF67_9LACT|nr:sugar kinase [Lactococcus petauri]OUK05185.1 2-dehydro-3-deoxygluconokinase [Lactococcus petauri]